MKVKFDNASFIRVMRQCGKSEMLRSLQKAPNWLMKFYVKDVEKETDLLENHEPSENK
jgi:hypothetical protein